MASKASKLRIVKCPKCLRLLTEFSDVPVYTCGGCGQVLKAKNGQANNGNSASQMLGSISSEKDPSQHVSDGGGSLNGISTLLNGQAALFSTDSNNSADIDHVGEHKHVAVPSEKASCSDSENNYHKEEESSGCTENSSMESVLTDDNLSCTRQPETLRDRTIFVASDQQERTIQVNVDSSFPNEQLDDSWKFSENGSVDSSSGCKINATENSPASEEDIGDADPRNISCEKMNVPTASSSHAYDGSDSSHDGVSDSHERCLALPSAVGNKEVSDSNNTNGSDGKEDVHPEDGKDSKPHVQSGNLSSNSPVSERCGASLAVFGSSGSSNRAYCRENSRHSEVFHSARKELQDDLLSMSPSRDSSFRNLSQNSRADGPSRLRNLEKDRMELLRKVDELRDHLTRPFVQGREGNRGFHILGTRQGGHWPSLYDRGSEKALQHCCNSNITQTHSRSFGQRATIAQPYQSLRVPVSGQGNSSCLHQHPRDWCIPVQLPPGICCKACTPHVFCYPSTVSGPRCCKNCDIAPCSHRSQTRDQHFGKLYCKEKRQPLKRHCRPVSGGAPFVICNHCVRLLQLPADFLVSRARYHKLKCGGCSQVLVFLSHGGGRIVPHDGSQLEDPAPSEADNAMEHDARPELSADRCCAGPQGDPVSYCEEYGPPFSSYGYSTDGEPAPHIPSSLQQYRRRHGKQAVGSPLHRLMGYDSATELIYQPSDEDEAYESRDLARFYRTSNEIRSSEADSGTGVGYHPLQGQPEIVCRPEHTQEPTEDGSVMRSTNPPRGGSPLRGFFKKGIKELNHGLESMKPKWHTGGRVIPAP